MKKYIGIMAILLLFAACQESVDERLKREAQEFTEKQCPRKMMEGIMLDSMSYNVEKRTMQYYYTLSGDMDSQQRVDEVSPHFKEVLLQGIRNSVEIKKAKEEGVSFNYKYLSASTGGVLLDITYKKEDYQ